MPKVLNLLSVATKFNLFVACAFAILLSFIFFIFNTMDSAYAKYDDITGNYEIEDKFNVLYEQGFKIGFHLRNVFVDLDDKTAQNGLKEAFESSQKMFDDLSSSDKTAASKIAQDYENFANNVQKLISKMDLHIQLSPIDIQQNTKLWLNLGDIIGSTLETMRETDAKNEDEYAKRLSGIKTHTLIFSAILLVFITIVCLYLKSSIISSLDKITKGLKSFFDFSNYKSKTVDLIQVSNKDEFGQIANLINQDITHIKSNTQTDTKAIEESMQVAKKIEGGDLTARIEINPASPQLLQLKNVLNDMLNDLQKKIGENTNEIARVFNSYTNRDFTTEVGGKVGRVGEVTNILGKQIREIFSQNLQTAENLLSKSKALKELVETLTDGANTQARSLEESSAAVEQMSSSMNAINERSTEVIKQTEDIKGVTGVIRDIADQINLLALNAAIEAARAGEHGRGFAVVADEVRKLAEKTSKSLTEIEANINVLVQSINEMSDSIKEQTQAINQINDAIVHIDETTKNNVQIANQTLSITSEVDSVSRKVLEDVKKNKF